MSISARTLLLLLSALLLESLLPASPAHALERKVMGDVLVKEGETVEEISTAWGDVVVEGRVEGDVRSGLGNIDIEGPVGGDVKAGFGDISVNAPVEGNLKAGFGDVDLGREAQIGGKVYVRHGSIEDHSEAEVRGPQVTGMADLGEDSPLVAFLGMIGWAIMTSLLIAATVLLVVVAPGPLRASVRSLEAAPVRSFLLGLGSVPVAIVASILLAITGVGALLLLLFWPAYLLFGPLVVAYFLGRKVLFVTGRYRAGDVLAAAVGAFLVSATCLIPFVGGLVFVILALLGTGGAVAALLARRSFSAPRTTYASYEDYLRERP